MGSRPGSVRTRLALAVEGDDRGAEVPDDLDSLGDLRIFAWRSDEAHSYLEHALALSLEKGNKWYQGQAHARWPLLSGVLSGCRGAGYFEKALESPN